VVRLPVWLVVNGTVSLVTGLLMWISMGLVFLLRKPAALIPLIVAIVISFLFTIPWNIIGAVSLFRDSMGCQINATPLWAMTLASLCFQWWSLLQNCGCTCNLKFKKTDYD